MKALFLIFLLCFSTLILSADEETLRWQKSGDEDGISTFYRKMPGSPLYALKGLGNIDAPLWKVASVLLDTKRAFEWVDSLEESTMLKRLNPFTYIEYNHIRTPFILKDREFVTQVEIKIDPDKKSFSLNYSPTSLPGPKTDFVRGEIAFGIMKLTSIEGGKKSFIDGELHCDPKGSIPNWVVNLFQKNWPRNTIEGIRKQAAKKNIAIPEEFKTVIEKTTRF